jgi:hypothetical protein
MQNTAQAAMNPVENVIQSAVANSGDISTKNLVSDVNNLIAKSPELTSRDSKNILSTVLNVRSPGVAQAAGGDINKVVDVFPSTMNPTDALDGARNLEKQGYAYLNAANPASPNYLRYKQIGEAYLGGAESIMEEIEKSVGTNVNLDALKTPEVLAKLGQISPKLAQSFKDAKTIGDMRQLMAPFYRLNKMVELTKAAPVGGITSNLGAAAQGAIGGGKIGGLPGAVAGTLASPVIQGVETAARSPVASGGSLVARGAGNVVSNLGQAAPAAMGALGTLVGGTPGMVAPPTNQQLPAPVMADGSTGGMAPTAAGGTNPFLSQSPQMMPIAQEELMGMFDPY